MARSTVEEQAPDIVMTEID